MQTMLRSQNMIKMDSKHLVSNFKATENNKENVKPQSDSKPSEKTPKSSKMAGKQLFSRFPSFAYDTDIDSRDSGISTGTEDSSQTAPNTTTIVPVNDDDSLDSLGELYDLFNCNSNTPYSSTSGSPSTKRRRPEHRFHDSRNNKMPTDFEILKISSQGSIDNHLPCAGHLFVSTRVIKTPSPNKDEYVHTQLCSSSSTPCLSSLENEDLDKLDKLENSINYSLPIIERPRKPHPAYGCIDSHTLASLLGSLTKEQFLDRYMLIDCRYPFEYNGGHINYAINLYDSSCIREVFYPDNEGSFHEINSKKPIFYCEFSQKRGPSMAAALRSNDRNRNQHRYPFIDYKEIYLLDRGYKNFFEDTKYKKFCQPSAYIEMYDSSYAGQLSNFESHKKRAPKKRKASTQPAP